MKNMKKAEKHEMMRCPSCKGNTLYLAAEIKDLLRVCRCRKCGNDFYIWPSDLEDKEAAELIRQYLEKEIRDGK